MKNLLSLSACVLALSFSVGASAAVTIEKSSVSYAEIQLRLTGAEAELLSEIAYQDSTLSEKANPGEDYSTIRSIKCVDGECVIKIEGELSTSANIHEFHTSAFNKKLKGLKAGEILVTAPSTGKGDMGESRDYDGKVTRALLANHTYGESKAKLKKYNLSGLGKKDFISVPLFKVEKELGALKIVCHSTLNVDTGIKNSVSETCSIEAVAVMK